MQNIQNKTVKPVPSTPAVEEWLVQVGCPVCVHDAVRRKFRKLKLTEEEIRTDMACKVARHAAHDAAQLAKYPGWVSPRLSK